MRPKTCEACGREAEAGERWFALHLGIRTPELLAVWTPAEIQKLGEHLACSTECVVALVRPWAEECRARRNVVVT